jgi:adenylyltransferase/sulfurtransferase
VREPWEHEYAAIAGDVLNPLNEIYTWGPALDPAARYVVYCHTGVRSAHACMLLTDGRARS